MAHNLLYYPYASFTSNQLPLLKVAALYFDKLTILDPVGASWATVGADDHLRKAVKLLESAGLLEVVSPADVLAKYADPIADAVRQDMGDKEFLGLCEQHSRATGKKRWTLSLAKVPQDLRTDQTMRYLMGDFARSVSRVAHGYVEAAGGNPQDYLDYSEGGHAYDEQRKGYQEAVEYRYADFPLALGESIMMNHALFAGLLHAGATPIADESFHSQALSLKLRRATQEPLVQQVLADRARARQLKADQLAVATLRDPELALPVLSPDLPLEDVLEYRQKHDAALQGARRALGAMARRIEAEPWSEALASDLEHKVIPDIGTALDEARKARDEWQETQRAKLALKAGGLLVGVATAVLAVVAAPLTPIALATAGLGLVSGLALPGGDWLLDWRNGKKSPRENGLHYLLKM
ncbi:MAG: hypothetical protein IT373_09515 [Polyangiaceae bacterium]|nr:hypothetical protein [Polyangiaceae bacterium]